MYETNIVEALHNGSRIVIFCSNTKAMSYTVIATVISYRTSSSVVNTHENCAQSKNRVVHVVINPNNCRFAALLSWASLQGSLRVSMRTSRHCYYGGNNAARDSRPPSGQLRLLGIGSGPHFSPMVLSTDNSVSLA